MSKEGKTMSRRQPTEAQKQATQEKRAKMRLLAAQIAKLSDVQRQEIVDRLGLVTVEGRSLSVHNQCMLALQVPEASVVGGFRQWQLAGRMVIKGQHGACIWIPIGTHKGEGEDEATDPTGFTLATVFDISQTAPQVDNRLAMGNR